MHVFSQVTKKKIILLILHLVTATGGESRVTVSNCLYRYLPEKWRSWNWGALYSKTIYRVIQNDCWGFNNCHTQYTWDGVYVFFYLIEQHSAFLLHKSFRKYPGTEGTNQNHHWNHHRWHATNSLEWTRLLCWCLYNHKGCTYRALVRYVTKTWNVVLLNKKIHILLSQVYCVWQVVKTPRIISNNPVYCTFCIVYYEKVWQTVPCHSTVLHLRCWCQLLIILFWWCKKQPRNTGNTYNLYLPAPHMVTGNW